MKIAFVGCGYVAGLYEKTLARHPDLDLVGAYDLNERNLEAFAPQRRIRRYKSLQELTEDENVELVVNLTNPRNHYDVTHSCLVAQKHVYSEKPLAMTAKQGQALVELARAKAVCLASAPCSMLGETAQTLWKAVRDGVVGRIRLVYANLDDGLIAPKISPWTWVNDYGVQWPAKDEFEVGCTYEHAGYVLTWLAAIFGPATGLFSFASCQIPDKGVRVDTTAPDFTVGCVEYPHGVVARVTCGLIAPRDRSITVVGDEGVLFVGNVRNDAAPVMIRRSKLARWQSAIARHTEEVHHWLGARIHWPGPEALFQRRYSLPRKPVAHIVSRQKPVDFLLGPKEIAEAVREKRACRLCSELGLHIVELVEALQYPSPHGRKQMTTTFPPIQPMPWAQ